MVVLVVLVVVVKICWLLSALPVPCVQESCAPAPNAYDAKMPEKKVG